MAQQSEPKVVRLESLDAHLRPFAIDSSLKNKSKGHIIAWIESIDSAFEGIYNESMNRQYLMDVACGICHAENKKRKNLRIATNKFVPSDIDRDRDRDGDETKKKIKNQKMVKKERKPKRKAIV